MPNTQLIGSQCISGWVQVKIWPPQHYQTSEIKSTTNKTIKTVGTILGISQMQNFQKIIQGVLKITAPSSWYKNRAVWRQCCKWVYNWSWLEKISLAWWHLLTRSSQSDQFQSFLVQDSVLNWDSKVKR